MSHLSTPGDMHSSRREEAEQITRRGLEESVRLLDEQLSRASARAEAESKQRREAERKLAQAASELATLRAAASSAQAERSTVESERLNRELRERSTHQRLESAGSVGIESAVRSRARRWRCCRSGSTPRAARVSLSESATLAERELAALTERVAQQRQVKAEQAEAYRRLSYRRGRRSARRRTRRRRRRRRARACAMRGPS